MEKQAIEDVIISKIKEYCDDNDIEVTDVSLNTRLMGSNGVFDSMDLVNFIVELEEELEDNHDIEITLTDEKAMSRRTSPFLNPETLTAYILEKINE